jgi:hypothetical protein
MRRVARIRGSFLVTARPVPWMGYDIVTQNAVAAGVSEKSARGYGHTR